MNAILDFYQFDEQVAESVGPTYEGLLTSSCANSLRQITADVEAQLANATTAEALKKSFLAGDFDDGDFLYMMADIAAESGTAQRLMQVQYGFQQELCRQVETTDPVAGYRNWTLKNYYPIFGNNAGYKYLAFF